jgi:hypothetical protein
LLKQKEHLNEDSTFDKRQYLEKWRDEELKKLRDMDYEKFRSIPRSEVEKANKLYFYKRAKINKIYHEKEKELLKRKDQYGHYGNINASVIYHYTTGDSLIGIIEDDEIVEGNNGYVSFSTSGNLYKHGFTFWGQPGYERDDKNIGCKIKFDLNAMKRDGIKFKIGGREQDAMAGEYELRVRDAVDNINKYIIEVYVFKDKEENFNKVIEFLNNKNIKYTVINSDKPFYKEEEKEILRKEKLVNDKNFMIKELERLKRIYKILTDDIDEDFLNLIKAIYLPHNIGNVIQILFSMNNVGTNYFSPVIRNYEDIVDYFKSLDPDLFKEINVYHDYIKNHNAYDSDKFYKILKNKINDLMNL